METFDSLYEKYAAPSYRVAFLILYQGFPDRQDHWIAYDMLEEGLEDRGDPGGKGPRGP